MRIFLKIFFVFLLSNTLFGQTKLEEINRKLRTSYYITIQNQSLDAVFRIISSQTGVRIVFNSEDVRGKRIQQNRFRENLKSILDKITSPFDLTYIITEEGSIKISKALDNSTIRSGLLATPRSVVTDPGPSPGYRRDFLLKTDR